MELDEKICRNSPVIPREICLKSVNIDRLKEFHAREQQTRTALSKPLPGAAGDAFLKGAIKCGDVVVCEVMPIHQKALQAVESPLLKLVGGAAANGGQAKQEFEPEDERRICYIFTAHPKELWKVPKEQLGEHIKAKADEVFGATSCADINAICTAVLAQYHRFIQATIRRREELESQEKSFFQVLESQSVKPAE